MNEWTAASEWTTGGRVPKQPRRMWRGHTLGTLLERARLAPGAKRGGPWVVTCRVGGVTLTIERLAAGRGDVAKVGKVPMLGYEMALEHLARLEEAAEMEGLLDRMEDTRPTRIN